MTPSPTDIYALASAHIAQIDEEWARLIKLVGPCTHQAKPAREPYEALIRAVAYQQLHARAGDAIIARFLALYPESSFPSAAQILATEMDIMRACGFSTRKIATIKSIADASLHRIVPSRTVADCMNDEELIARLVKLPGIGRWTVEMLLIYTLERLDVLPADDFGVRKAYARLKRLNTLPTRKQMEQLGLQCSPYRTIASWYLWRLPIEHY